MNFFNVWSSLWKSDKQMQLLKANKDKVIFIHKLHNGLNPVETRIYSMKKKPLIFALSFAVILELRHLNFRAKICFNIFVYFVSLLLLLGSNWIFAR